MIPELTKAEKFKAKLARGEPCFGAQMALSDPAVAEILARAEFFNVFNLVNFGLPSNVVRGTGFGVISKTAGNSRQLQFSLKLLY